MTDRHDIKKLRTKSSTSQTKSSLYDIVSKHIDNRDWEGALKDIEQHSRTSASAKELVRKSSILPNIVSNIYSESASSERLRVLEKRILPYHGAFKDRDDDPISEPFFSGTADSQYCREVLKHYPELDLNFQEKIVGFVARKLPADWACDFIVAWRKGSWPRDNGEEIITHFTRYKEPAEISTAFADASERLKSTSIFTDSKAGRASEFGAVEATKAEGDPFPERYAEQDLKASLPLRPASSAINIPIRPASSTNSQKRTFDRTEEDSKGNSLA